MEKPETDYAAMGFEMDPRTGSLRVRANETEKLLVYVKDVKPINDTRTGVLMSRERLDTLIEIPLLNACKILYDANVATSSASAHAGDITNGFASIELDEASLSEENRQIVEQLVKEDNARYGMNNHGERTPFLIIPMNETSTISEVSERATELVQRFVKQEYYSLGMYNIEQFREILGADPNDESWTPELLTSRQGGYYNPQTEFFYLDPIKYRDSLKQHG